MPRLTIERPHTLGEEGALQRLKDKVSALKDAYQGQFSDLREQWNGNKFLFGFRAAGMKFAGTATVGASQVKLDAELPLAVMMFKGVIRARVNEELGHLLA
jgi:putative polyhydroxyalkanoate system protein